MPILPERHQPLIAALSKLPGIGPRSAERIALHLVQAESGAVKQLAEAILDARERVRFCEVCGALTEKSPCAICADPRREPRWSAWSSGRWTSSASRSPARSAASIMCWAARSRR